MSKATIASVSDVSAGYWNPAALVDGDYEFSGALMHSSYFSGIANFDYMAFSARIDSMSNIGVSVIRFAVDDIPDTRFLYDANGSISYDRVRFFSAADYAFLLSYSRKFKNIPQLSVGANFKIVYRNVGQFANAWGFGLDVGAKYRVKTWAFGVMARDITGTFNMWSHNSSLLIDVYTQTGNEIPENTIEVTLPRFIFGVAKTFKAFEKFGILAELNLETTLDGKRNTLVKSGTVSLAPVAGIELDYSKIAYLRFGVGNFQQIKDFDGSLSTSYQPNFGLGIVIKNLKIDYALTDIGNQAEALYSHVFSLKFGWDSK